MFQIFHHNGVLYGQKVNQHRKKGQKKFQTKNLERLDQMEQENGW